MRTIYDFGANNGDDIPYYLRKSDRVVAVEANPSLAEKMQKDFARDVSAGRLYVENCALTIVEAASLVPFYIHRTDHVRSQFPRPDESILDEFDTVSVPARLASDIIRQYGAPYYVKIDLENFDEAVLRELFSAGIRPEFISAECHSVSVFAALVSLGGYDSFKLVDGPSVAARYRNHEIRTAEGTERHTFPPHSAGPFGDDIPGPWMAANNFFHLLSMAGLGWKDVHAARDIRSTERKIFSLPARHEMTVPLSISLRYITRALPGSIQRAVRRRLPGKR